MPSTREAAATETAAVDAAVAAKAAAAANERRALDVRTPSKKPDMPKEPGGGAGLMDGEDFSGGAVFGVGARVRVLAATAPGLLPRFATGCGETIVMAFDPRTREYTVKPLALAATSVASAAAALMFLRAILRRLRNTERHSFVAAAALAATAASTAAVSVAAASRAD